MKYILATNVKDIHSTISPVFARAHYFGIYDTETKNMKFIENKARLAQGGAGVKAAQFIVDQNVDKLIVVRLGENSYRVLQLANIEILQTPEDTLENIFHLCESNQLNKLDCISKGLHHHG